MRNKSVVRQHRIEHTPLLVCLLLAVSSIYLSPLALNHRFIFHQQSAPAPILPTQKLPTVDAPQERFNQQQVNFVSGLIRKERPTHPNSDKLAKLIVDESLKAEIDPLFVAAVVRAESMFKHKAVSQRGATGLMQIMPKTGHYVAKLSKIELKNSDGLHDPQTNIRLGISYLKYLNAKFKGDHRKVLVAYNWGPANLIKAQASGANYPKESIEYVERVLSHHSAWRSSFTALAPQKQLRDSLTAIG
jgi:hypothetical protein